jgi:hypothetical protein
LAGAAVKLLASCGSSCPSSEKDFQSLFKQCHLHVRFAEPREIAVKNERLKLKVDELIVSFPTNTGGIWLRSGDDYSYFTKFDPEPCLEINELIKSGQPQSVGPLHARFPHSGTR